MIYAYVLYFALMTIAVLALVIATVDGIARKDVRVLAACLQAMWLVVTIITCAFSMWSREGMQLLFILALLGTAAGVALTRSGGREV